MRPKPLGSGLIATIAFLALSAVATASPTNTRITSGPSGTIFTDSATFTFTSPEEGGFQCRLDGADWSPCASPKTYSSLADGRHSFEVRALNGPGNADPTPSVRDFAVVTEPPETTITSAPSGTIAVGSATFAFASSQPGRFQCRLDSAEAAAWEACSSPQAYSALADGAHAFEVRAENEAGEVDPTPAVAGFAVDTVAPQTTLVTGPRGAIAVDSAIFSFTSSEPGSVECRLDTAAWRPCSSPKSYSSLGDGPHRFEARGIDAVGNTDSTPAAAGFTVDTKAPRTTIDSGPSGTIEATSATFAFTATEPARFECRLDSAGGPWSPCASPESYSSLVDGPHGFEVRAVDGVGNVEATPAAAGFTVYTGPPKPVAGESIDLEPVSGTVELQCPGDSGYSKLTSFRQVPLSCVINTRHGVVDLTASKGGSGELQDAHFWGGVFTTSQQAGDEQEVELKLAGRRLCERRGTAGKPVARLSRSGRGGRKLWGSGKGNFKTSGSYGSATVRGTTWLVVDRCDSSTLIKVGEGTVWVRDFVKDRSLTLTTGQQYLAKATIPRLDPDQFP